MGGELLSKRPLSFVYALLAGLTALFLVLGLAYARTTPAWQAPDEPAHYNYVAYLAEHAQLPILKPGDYPDGKIPIGPAVRPTDSSAFRYESHQPPLFYALAALVYKLHASLFAVRALSVLFGAALLPVAFLISREMWPAKPWLWLGIGAFAGFIPMHLFIAGAAENDTLADLVLSLVLLAYLRRWPVMGLLFGLALLTKLTIYLPAAALFLLALRRERVRGVAIAIVVAAWWFTRNALVYGWTDPAIQIRQAQVAGSQTQTGDFGLSQLGTFVATSFHSFWGQFGWMGIPLPERDYYVLIALTLAVCVGWAIRRKAPNNWLPLAIVFVGVLLEDLAYNLKFLQPQGRYLFPALVPIAVFYVLGFAALFPARLRPQAVAALSFALILFSAYTLQRVLVPAFR